jgi:hypothetical protein
MSRLIFNADTLGGTTTLSSADAVGNFTITVPAVNGTLSVKDASNDATFRNITLTGAVLAGAWNGTTIAVAYGGTGATTLTGYVKGNGTSAMTASATIPNTDITGLGTMSTQNANAVAITGGTISGLSAAIPVASGGTGATTLTGLVYGNGTSAMTAASAAQIVAAIGSTAVANATLAATATLATTATNIAGGLSGSIPYQTAAGTTSLLAAGTNGQVLTLAAGLPSWVSVAGVGTVTSVDGSGGTTGLTLTGGPITSSGTLTLGGTLAVANGGTGVTSLGTGVVTALGVNVGTAGAVVVNGGALGTPSSGTLTNATGLPVSTGISGLGTGVATALAVNVGSAGAPVVNGGALGTPSSGTVTNLTGTASININGTVGATTANTGAFTTLSATGITTVAAGSAALPAIVSTTGTADTGFWFPAADTVAASTAGTERLRIDSSGNVGIGTSSPTAPLDVKVGTGNFSVGLQGVANTQLTSSGNMRFNTTAGTTIFTQNTTESMRIDTSGNLGIGTSSPTTFGGSLVVYAATNPISVIASGNANAYLRLYSTSDNNMYLANLGGSMAMLTANTERMRIDSVGNVGIGTSSPNASALLDVQSTTKGVRMPNMTTTQKNAIASPAAGLMVFDTTLSKLAVYSGAAWQTITSV